MLDFGNTSYPDNIFSDDRIAINHVQGELFDELEHVEECWPQEVLWQWGKLVLTYTGIKRFLKEQQIDFKPANTMGQRNMLIPL